MRLLRVVVVAVVMGASAAGAQSLNVGPSLPAVAVTPGDTHPVSLAPGAGVTVGADFFPTTLAGKPAHWLTVGADLFGAVLPSAGTVSGNGSMALHVCALEAVCVGLGVKLLDTGGAGALNGRFSGRSLFVLLAPDFRLLGFLLGQAAPAAVPK